MAMEPHFSRVLVVVVFMLSEIISCWTTVKPVFSVPDIKRTPRIKQT